MSATFEAEILPQLKAISRLTGEVLCHLEMHGVDARAAHHVALVLDELLVNLGSHGNSADKPANVRIMIEADKVRAEIRDSGPEFDIRTAPEPTLTQNIEEREIGGLGLFLVRQFACEIGYERRGDTNHTRFAVARATA